MKQTLKYIYTVVLDNLKFSESKNSVLLALNSGIIVFTSSYLLSNSLAIVLLDLFVLAFCLCSIITVLFAIKSISLENNSAIKPLSFKTPNLLYYKYIASFTARQYLEDLKKAYGFPSYYQTDEFEYDLAKQIVVTSKIAVRKFRLFNIGLFLMITGIVFAGIMFLLEGLVL